MKTELLLLAGAFAVLTAVAEKQPFERYQSIVDRQVFGQPPAGFDPTKAPSEVASAKGGAAKELTKEQEQLQKSVNFSVIIVDSRDGKPLVGFTDNTDPKSPRHYSMKVGETRDGWFVKEADAAEKTMTIVKDGIELALKFGELTTGGKPVASAPGRAAPTVPAAANGLGGRSSLLSGRRLSGGAPQAGAALGLRARREQRMQAARESEAKAAEARAQAEAEREAKAAEERAQAEAERQAQREELQALKDEVKKAREERLEAERKKEAENEESAPEENQ